MTEDQAREVAVAAGYEVDGDCYPSASDLQEQLIGMEVDALLVHGTVQHSELTDIRFGHAWVEVDIGPQTFCFDFSNGSEHAVPKDTFYTVGVVQDVHRYTYDEASMAKETHMNYGPWPEEDDLS